MKRKFERPPSQFMDLFYAVFMFKTGNKFNYLPELCDVIGKKETFKLLDIFAGCTIVFPSMKEVSVVVKNLDIYLQVKNIKKSNKCSMKEIFRIVAGNNNNDINAMAVENAYNEFKELIENTGESIEKKMSKKKLSIPSTPSFMPKSLIWIKYE